jgi:hypothetical protein
MSRDRLIELVEDGMVDPMMALQMCAAWMTDADVAEMLDANELSERFDPVDEDEEAPLLLTPEMRRYPDAVDQLEVLKNDYLGGNV